MKKTVSLDTKITDRLIEHSKEWGLLSQQSLFRLEHYKDQPSKAEVVECALLLFIKSKNDK